MRIAKKIIGIGSQKNYLIIKIIVMSNLIKNLLTFCLFLLISSSLLAQAADLKLEYETSPSPAIINVGDTLQVRYEVSNTGLTNATGSQMTINLEGGFQIVETMPTAGTFAANVWNIGTVPSEESEVLLVFITKTSEGLGTLEAEITQMTVSYTHLTLPTKA